MKSEKRIVSTVILGIILAINLVLACLMAPVSWSGINAISSGDSGAAAAALFVGLAYGIIIVLFIIIYSAIFISSAICLIFTFKNRKSTYKPTRIISYVYDGLFIAVMALSLIKIILLLCGI